MKIVFTKLLDEQWVAEQLGDVHSYSFINVIKIHPMQISPYPLGNKSLLFTSVNGVQAFFESGFKPNEVFTDTNYNKIYAVGVKTKFELRKFGFGTYKVFSSAAEMSDFITKKSTNEKFIHFCGNISLDILNRKLPLQNIRYKKEVVYKTEELYPKIDNDYEVVAFFSPSGVRSFMKYNSLEGKKLFAIGKTTETELKKNTDTEVLYSKKNTLADLIKIMKENLPNK